MNWEVLSEEISKIFRSRSPLYEEFTEANTIADPVIAHGDGLRFPGSEGSVGNSLGAEVVGRNDSWILREVHRGEIGANPSCSTSIDVEGCIFGFASALTDCWDLAADGEQGAVGSVDAIFIHESVVTAAYRDGVSAGLEGGIRVDDVDHVAACEADNAGRMRMQIVE